MGVVAHSSIPSVDELHCATFVCLESFRFMPFDLCVRNAQNTSVSATHKTPFDGTCMMVTHWSTLRCSHFAD